MWLDDDSDKVVAWLRARHEVCQHCGTIESDWIDPDTGWVLEQPKWAATTYRCYGCAELERAAKAVPEKEPGVRVILLPQTDDVELDDEEEEADIA